MVLVQTARYFVLPDGATAQLVQIAALRHQDVAKLERVALDPVGFDDDLLHLCQIELTVLDVRDSKVRTGRGRRISLTPLGKPSPDFGKLTKGYDDQPSGRSPRCRTERLEEEGVPRPLNALTWGDDRIDFFVHSSHALGYAPLLREWGRVELVARKPPPVGWGGERTRRCPDRM